MTQNLVSRCLVFLLVGTALASEPENFDRLTFHKSPKPLPKDAVVDDWPRFLGPEHNLHSKETKLLKSWPESGPQLVWEVARGTGQASPVVANGRLVLFHELEGRETIECLDAETGRRYWIHDYPVTLGSSYGIADATRAAPVIDDDLVFTVGARGDLTCIEMDTGSVAWQLNLDRAFGKAPLFFARGGSPLVVDDQLIVNSGGDACVVSLDKRTGSVIWKSEREWQASYASPVPAMIHGKLRVLVFAGGMTNPPTGGLLSIDPSNGAIEGVFPWRARQFASVNAASPVPLENAAFITESYSEGGAMVGFDSDGAASELWLAPRFRGEFVTPVAHEGHLYGVSGTAGTEIVCYEVSTGRELWRDGMDLDNARLGRASLMRVDDAFLCIGDQGTLLWLDLSPQGASIQAQAQLFRAPETWGVPALSRGLLYVNQNAMGSRLICYDLRGE